MGMESVPLRKLIERTLSGEIRIPAFQRGYVWTPEGVAFLMDSIYRGYPVGSLLVWRTKEQLEKEKNLGPFELPEPKSDWPIDYVLDGQQRLTSIVGVFQTELKPVATGDWFDIYFDLDASEGAFEGQFLPLGPDQVDEARHFPLSTLFDSVGYRKATERFSEENVKRLDDVQARFKEALIPVNTMEAPERDEVAIVFERINRTGIPLDAFQLLSAWTWSTEFDLSEAFQDLAAEVEPFGFGKIEHDPNLLMKCCAAVIDNDASAKAIVNLNGPIVRERFGEVKAGILGAIDFLAGELKVHSLRAMPFPAMIVPLARFFATDAAAGTPYDDDQRRELTRWFWRACFARRYSSGVGRAHAADIAALAALRDDPKKVVSDFACTIEGRFFYENTFSLSSVNSRTMIMLLAQSDPMSFISGQAVDLKEVLKTCNRTEFHHIFPKRHLASADFAPRHQNLLANICFLSSADNQKIKAESPSVYKELLPQEQIGAILQSNIIPEGGLDMNYIPFITARAGLLVEAANKLIE